jgi:hypothetical protein
VGVRLECAHEPPAPDDGHSVLVDRIDHRVPDTVDRV